MKKNYQIELDHILEDIKKQQTAPRLLLHSCCGPCSSYVISYLMEYFDITIFYYNPNIFPQEEFELRKAEQIRLIDALNKVDEISYTLQDQIIAKQRKSPVAFVSPEYRHEEFLSVASGLEQEPEGGKRCDACFRLRLEKTAAYAEEHGFDYFATTLSVSPHKNAVLLNEIGKDVEKEAVYLVSDFKKREGYKISILLSAQYDLYRQHYCGCEYSDVSK